MPQAVAYIKFWLEDIYWCSLQATLLVQKNYYFMTWLCLAFIAHFEGVFIRSAWILTGPDWSLGDISSQPQLNEKWGSWILKTIVDFCFDIFHLIFTQGRAINSPNANWFLRWNWKVTLADVCIISHFYTHNYYQWSCCCRTNLFVNYYFTNLFGSGIRNKNKAGVSSWKITLCFTSYKEEDEACHVLVSL